MKEPFPVYDLCAINRAARQDLLIERFAPYLEKHYRQLHRPHGHSFYHLVLFTSGGGYHTIDFERFEVRAGQVYFMIPGQVHSWHFEGEVDGYLVHFNAALFSEFLYDRRFLERFPFFSGHGRDGVCQLPPQRLEEAEGLFGRMLAEAAEGQDDGPDLIRLKLLELFVLVRRSCAPAQAGSPPQKLQLLRQFQQLIDTHYRELRLPKEYAELLYVTPNHLNALCTELLGKTAGDLIRDRVMLEAKRLLTQADLTVTQIADALHFNDNAYFNRFFRKQAGITPDAFRKRFLQPSIDDHGYRDNDK